MPEFKKRPKVDKPKVKLITIPPKQIAHILKEKYRRQLDQRPEGSESETTDATDQVEGAGRQTVGEITSHRPQSRQRQNPTKQKDGQTAPREKATSGAERPKTRPANPLKTKETQEQARPRQPSSSTSRQRPASPVSKKADNRAILPTNLGREDVTSSVLPCPQEAGQSHRQSRPKGQLSTSSGGTTSAKPPKAGQRSRLLKERPRTIFKTKVGIPGKAPGPAPKVKPAIKAAKATKQTAQQRMKQQAVARGKQAAKITADLGKKAIAAVVKAMAALVGSIVGLLGGGVLLVLLIFVAIVAAVASSPFGIFFSGGGGTGGDSVPTVAVCEAVNTINMEYNAKLAEEQSGNYDSIELVGQAADWPDVLAVFSSRYAADEEDGVDVATLDADRVDKLTETFWDMTEVETKVEQIYHSDGEGGGWTERILHITITPKTAEDMKTAYDFTDFQISALDELMADPAALASLAGSLEITNTEAQSTSGRLAGGFVR